LPAFRAPHSTCALSAALALALIGGAAHAQTPTFHEYAEADSASVNVTLTVAGIPVTLHPDPIDVTTSNGVGSTDAPLGSASLGLPGLSVITLSGMDNQTADTADANEATSTAMASVGDASLLGGLVQIHNLVVSSGCDLVSGSAVCTGSTTLGSLVVAGQTIALGTIAPNTQLAVIGSVPITVAGLPIHLPVNLALTLNEQELSGNDVDYENIYVAGAHLTGSANAGLVQLTVDISVGGPDNEVSDNKVVLPPKPCTAANLSERQPNPSRVDTFYACAFSGWILDYCPSSLVYDRQLEQCEWPH
jgi:hypothetical protein